MEISFQSDIALSAIMDCLRRRGITSFSTNFAERYAGEVYRFSFKDERLFREVTLWAAAAFSCGLIERPEIERM